jgi:hypothetical protein
MLDERTDARNVFRGMAWMPDLDAVDPVCDERCDPVASSGMRRMRENREPARAVDQRNGVRYGEAFLGDVRGTSVAEVSVKRIAEIHCPAFGNHRTRDVWSADSAVTCLTHNRVEVDTHPELVETRNDAGGARPPHFAKGDQL